MRKHLYTYSGQSVGRLVSNQWLHFWWFPFCQRFWALTKRRDDMEVDMVADMEVDMVADMVADIDINMEIQFGERV